MKICVLHIGLGRMPEALGRRHSGQTASISLIGKNTKTTARLRQGDTVLLEIAVEFWSGHPDYRQINERHRIDHTYSFSI